MKKRLIYLLPVLVALVSGCLKGTENTVVKPTPTGTFSGQFRRLHRAPGASIIDTLKANVQLVFESGTDYKLIGDTATVHAGSHGNYLFSNAGYYVAFDDATYPATGKPAKVHLYGTYQYYYNGSNVLQMVFNSADTLSYQYDLKKVN
jgi:hypothetical protein